MSGGVDWRAQGAYLAHISTETAEREASPRAAGFLVSRRTRPFPPWGFTKEPNMPSRDPERASHLYRARVNRANADVARLLGLRCVCCGSQRKLEVDHVWPRRRGEKGGTMRNATEIRRHPERYQRLCAECNNWKSDGPCCPCHFWDQTNPRWRRKAA